MNSAVPYLGETLALLTAVAWAIAVIFFKRSGETVHPIALNVFKNILALVLFLPTLPLFGESFFHKAPTGDYLLLLASGALGIGLADTLYFMSLNRLGAGLSAIVDCTYSPFVIALSIVWLGESLNVWQVVGVVLIVSAVLTATSRKASKHVTRRDLTLGILLGIGHTITVAVGIVMIKPLLGDAPLMWVSVWRIFSGLIVLIITLIFLPNRRAIMATLGKPDGRLYTVVGSFFGAYFSMILWLGGMKYASASIASALNQTANIFIFAFAALFLREPINPRKTAGIILGVAGAFLVTFA